MGLDEKSLKNTVVGDTEQRYRLITLWVSHGLHWFWDHDYKCFSQILEILSQCKQKERKSHNQDFKAAPAWIISSRQMESGHGALPGFKCWRAAVNSLCEKVSEIFTGSGVVALQRSDSS